MKFENDKKYLRFRATLITVTVFLFFYISNKILRQKFSINMDNLTLYLLIFVFVIPSLFFLIHSVYLVNRLLIFKNIFGFTLKKIELDSLKGRKIIYKNLPYKAVSTLKILGLFGDKYESSIEIQISLEDAKKYNFNGQILSNLGLKSLNEKIK
ncbi:hypothetical protein [Flavobacterium sp. GT3P67]|uniref:hypothetical protein n=1 Tax=Flavobacterium sp. GT3P67 TaxID=2541722 RepID=UPI0010476DE8|nr:hypothetical protein [Flavobacterium sp. GT3P67]TDE50032.1 hypothetical protein E0H99_13900 [Flavobacterium sp. GT3P67]